MRTRIKVAEAEVQRNSATRSRTQVERDFLVNAAGVVISGVAGVALVSVLMRHWGAVQYGIWITAFSLGQTASMFNFGLGRMVVRFVARAEPAKRVQILGAAFTLYLLL